MLEIVVVALLYAGLGALIGLLPYFLCKSQNKPNMGQLALLLCIAGGTLFIVLGVVIAIGFSIAAFVTTKDCRPVLNRQASDEPAESGSGSSTYGYYQSVSNSRLGLNCLSGPMRGRVYRLGTDGIMIGRDADCSVRFTSATPGISRHHCSVRWYNGGPALVDLGSSFGSYLADGRQLPPNYPTPIQPGNRFYLGSPQNMFELVVLR